MYRRANRYQFSSALRRKMTHLFASSHLRHSALNLGGGLFPVIVAIPCLGILARDLDPNRFSLIMLYWALVGYAGVLDLGLGRAIVPLVSERADDPRATKRLLNSALCIALALGVLGAVSLWSAAPFIVSNLFKVAPDLAVEAVAGLRFTAVTVPLLLPYIIIQGYWDGMQAFAEANLQRALSGSLPIILSTIAVTMFGGGVIIVMGGFLAGRLISLFFVAARQGLWRRLDYREVGVADVLRLLSFGGWVTAGGMIGPVMGYLDRFVLAFARGASIVAFYAAPAEAIFRLLVVPTAITRSLFPKLASGLIEVERARLLRETRLMITLGCVPAALVILALGPWILELWLGRPYREQSTVALQLLTLGFLASSYAQIPLTQLFAAGKPKFVAFAQAAEVVPFLLLAYWLDVHYGVVGAAIAWSVRNAIDLLVLQFLANRFAN